MCSGLVADLNLIASEAPQLQEFADPAPRVWNSIEIALRQEGLIREPLQADFGAAGQTPLEPGLAGAGRHGGAAGIWSLRLPAGIATNSDPAAKYPLRFLPQSPTYRLPGT